LISPVAEGVSSAAEPWLGAVGSMTIWLRARGAAAPARARGPSLRRSRRFIGAGVLDEAREEKSQNLDSRNFTVAGLQDLDLEWLIRKILYR
jgi:hypothetical protein